MFKMIAIIRKGTEEEKIISVSDMLAESGFTVNRFKNDGADILSVEGETDMLACFDIVEKVIDVRERCRLSSRADHPDSTVIDIGGAKIGDGSFAFIAGPCSVESEEQIIAIAKAVKNAGAVMLRGGAFKPRTSPYSFQGIGEQGLKLLSAAKKETGLPTVSEITDISLIEYYEDVDMLQVGARNMQNFELLRELGKTDKYILLKRGFSATVDELLMSAEYIMAGGNSKVILCERGIRTFENSARNTFDVSSIAVLKNRTHLPVIADPSHAAGLASFVRPLTFAACAAGADGAMIEVHNDPVHALCDGIQAITPEEFESAVRVSANIRKAVSEG